MFDGLAKLANQKHPCWLHGTMVVVLLTLMILVLSGVDKKDEDMVKTAGWLLLVPVLISGVLFVGSWGLHSTPSMELGTTGYYY